MKSMFLYILFLNGAAKQVILTLIWPISSQKYSNFHIYGGGYEMFIFDAHNWVGISSKFKHLSYACI